MRRALYLAIGAALALAPATLQAQIFNGTPLPVEFLDFVGGSGQSGTFGVQVGPYRGLFEANSDTGRSTATPQFALYCVDYTHFASNSNGLVNVSAVGGDLSNTRLNDFGRYQRTAYLSSLFDGWSAHEDALEARFGGDFTRKHVWSGLHSVIWEAGTGPAGLGSGNTRTAQARTYFTELADANAEGFSTDGWFVLSEADVALDASNSGQEFLMRASVPEPSSVLLMITGLALLVGVARRRFAEVA